MITLYHFGRALGLPDFSPFVVKVELLLKMADLPYELIKGNFRHAPKGKLPYIRDAQHTVSDSTLIRFYLESHYGVAYDSHLSEERKATLWALERMCEEHLYWGLVYDRWVTEGNFKTEPASNITSYPALLFKSMPSFIRPLVLIIARRKVKSSLHAQGMGRHTPEEIHRLCVSDIEALSTLLGTRSYFGGDIPCGADASLGAFVMACLCPAFQSPIRTACEEA